jgi:uncharacterized hydrophobic protein (TIGR00271 family)
MFIFKSQAERLRAKVQSQLEEYSRPSVDFFVLICISSAIAALGLALDNIAIIIGAMVVAPLITPIFGFSLAMLVLRARRLGYALFSILAGSLLAIITAILIGFLIFTIHGSLTIGTAFLTGVKPNILFFLVALLSGMAGAFAYAKPKTSGALPGIAISVAIIPPLSIVGLGISMRAWNLSYDAFLLFVFNLIGIIFGSILMFIASGFGREETKVDLNK